MRKSKKRFTPSNFLLKNLPGFTFIEIAVVVGVISIALPTIYAIFFLILQQQVKLLRLTEVKRQGTFLNDTMTTLVRNNATGIYKAQNGAQVCSNAVAGDKSYSTGTLYFKDKQSNWFDFNITSQKIASESSVATTSYLTAPTTPTKVLVTSFTSQCSVTSYATPIVIFTYDMCYNINGSCGSGSDEVSFHFQPTVKLRNY